MHKVELDLGEGNLLSLETGKLAKEANGSVVIRQGDTLLLATAVAAETPRPGIDFFPLLVDYEEKLYAVGRIPGGFFKREGKATETAVLTARKIDRPIRPLFPKGYRNDVQIVVTPLSVDVETQPDILAINGASAALAISDIPFPYPIAAARVGKIDGKFVVDPATEQMQKSEMDLVVAGSEKAILMLECGSEEVSEEDVFEGIKLAHKKIKDVIKLQKDLAAKVGAAKKEYVAYVPHEKVNQFARKTALEKIRSAMKISDYDKQHEELSHIKEEIKKAIDDGSNEELKKIIAASPADIMNVIDDLEAEIVRGMILNEGKRPDGRGFSDIRPLSCEVGILPRAHGSAVFSRGQTQVLTVATLGALGEVQKLDGISPEETKRYMHHYNFPAYSVGEVRPSRGPGRREIGHGALAEKALVPVVPSEEEFPYTLRLVSEVLGSNGSTSMASTCASTLALMDAGVKIKAPVAGISIGLITGKDKEVLITDIQGIEDHLGDMDFKVAGTRKGITAVQVDIKIAGLSFEVIEKALAQAKSARMTILDKIEAAIDKPRAELSQYAPRVLTLQIDPAKIGMVIGPGGKMIKSIVEETGAQIDIEDDGRVLVTAVDPEGGKRAIKIIEDLTKEAKVGEIYKGEVTRILPFGAFVEILPGKEGLVHISEIAPRRIAKVEDELNIGDEVIVKVIKVDEQGRVDLSRRQVTAQDKEKVLK
ncbi:MAG: polyribonucleotide nucleotidyltransferase [Candidatus Margulisbacteria bacterium]|nr:polyribonucleotide nucleotidyltransferase [Candidatus Margulisiibacteriota bacterium]